MKKKTVFFFVAFLIIGFFHAEPGYSNPKRQGKEYLNQGKELLKFQGNYEEAISYFEKAYDSFQEADHPKGMAESLKQIGNSYYQLSRYQESLESFQKALEIVNREDIQTKKASILTNIGKVYNELGRFDEAEKYLLEASDIYQNTNKPKGYADNQRLLGDVIYSRGRFKDSMPYFERALKIYLDRDEKRKAGITLKKIGNVYRSTGPLKESLRYYDEALKLFEEIGEKKQIADIQRSRGKVYRINGQYSEALKGFEESLETYKTTDQPYYIARQLKNIGQLYRYLGHYDKALEYHRQSVTIFGRLNIPLDIAKNYNNIGLVYLALGQYEKALEYFEEALKIFKKSGKRSHVPRSLARIGHVHYAVGDYEEALKYFGESMKIFRELGQPGYVAKILNYMGNVYLAQNDLKRSEELFREAMAEKRKMKEGKVRSFGMVQVSLATDQYEQALQSLADMGPRWFDTDPYRIQYYVNRGFALKGTGNFNEASGEFLKSVSLIEEMRERLSGGKMEFFRGGKTKTYSGLVSSLSERVLKGEGKDARFAVYGKNLQSAAFYFSESIKARTLLEAMAESQRGKTRVNVPEDTREKEQSFINELAGVESEWDSAYKRGENALKELQARKKELVDEFNELIKELRKEHPRYAALHYPRPLPPESIPLKDNEILLEYALGKKAGYLFVVRRGGVKKLLKIPIERKALEQKVKDFIQPMNAFDYKNFSVKKAGTLYRILLAEALKGIKGSDKVIIVPDGILGILPFEALVLKEGKGIKDSVYVGDRFSVTYYQSATVLALQRVLKDVEAKRALFALGNPIYHKKDFRYVAYKQGKPKPAIAGKKEKKEFAFRSLSVGNQWGDKSRKGKMKREIFYPPLFETEEEVRAIAKLFQVKPIPPDILLEINASETNLLKSPLNDYRYIHFATHADSLGNVQGIGEPFILLGQVENEKKDDGFLTLSEVLGMSLDAEIVVLSACVTARGKVMEGEGVANFARAFQHAGSRSIMVSLWEVASMQAVDYMKRYYGYLKAGKSRGDALKLARKDIKSKNPNPFFWAVFILHGEG